MVRGMGMRKLLPFITRTLARLSEGRVNFDYVVPRFCYPVENLLNELHKINCRNEITCPQEPKPPSSPPIQAEKATGRNIRGGKTGGSWGG